MASTTTLRMRTALLLTLHLLMTLALAAPQYRMFPRVRVPQSHYEVLKMRQSIVLNPRAVTDIKCVDRKAHIVSHDQDVAQLAICGGIGGDVSKCGGAPSTTQGRAGSALFTLRAVNEGAKITLSKRAWEQCVRAARDACPTGSLTATCVGGATSGDVAFSLMAL